jgi:hypothetical protein
MLLKGLQEQALLAGRYFINPRFATVELVNMTEVPIAHVGVVVAFVGKEGHDVTGDQFRHGNLVSKGEKGVWSSHWIRASTPSIPTPIRSSTSRRLTSC